MKQRLRYLVLSPILFLLLLLANSCGPFGKKAGEEGVHWDKVWIEPRVVSGGELYTLIRAEKIDSVLSDPSFPTSGTENSLEIVVKNPTCRLLLSLVAEDNSSRKLLDTVVTAGYYKASVVPSAWLDSLQLRSPVLLSAEFCGGRKTQVIGGK